MQHGVVADRLLEAVNETAERPEQQVDGERASYRAPSDSLSLNVENDAPDDHRGDDNDAQHVHRSTGRRIGATEDTESDRPENAKHREDKDDPEDALRRIGGPAGDDGCQGLADDDRSPPGAALGDRHGKHDRPDDEEHHEAVGMACLGAPDQVKAVSHRQQSNRHAGRPRERRRAPRRTPFDTSNGKATTSVQPFRLPLRSQP